MYQTNNFPLFWETTQGLFGKNRLARNHDFKDTTSGGLQLNIGIKFFFEFVFQTGSTRFIVSLCAIFNGNLHRNTLRRVISDEIF